MKQKRIRIIINSAIAAAVIGAWLSMVFRANGMLSSMGFHSLRYFTVLSNLLEAAASIVLAVCIARGKNSPKISLFKLVAASAVSLTFLVVMLFLGPLYGYPAMFRGANLWLHLIVPLAAIAEFIVLNDFEIPKKERVWVAASPLVYGIFYLANILINGAYGNDFYGFTLWGLPVACVIFAVILLMTFLTGVLLSIANAAVRKRAGE